MNLITRYIALPSLLIALAGVAGCRENPAQAAEPAESEQAQNAGFLEGIQAALFTETKTVPKETPVRVRLTQTVSTDTDRSGDQFTAELESPLQIDGETLAPAGSRVIGELPLVEDSNRVKGRAELTMTLQELIVDGSSYPFESHTLTIRAEDSKDKDAAVIAGSAAVGAVIGAITGGGKGAAIGAGLGGGAGTGYVLSTKGKEVEFAPETLFEFKLSRPVKLPVVEGGAS